VAASVSYTKWGPGGGTNPLRTGADAPQRLVSLIPRSARAHSGENSRKKLQNVMTNSTAEIYGRRSGRDIAFTCGNFLLSVFVNQLVDVPGALYACDRDLDTGLTGAGHTDRPDVEDPLPEAL